ncbi:VOC family protein [Paraliomyxa miuraensis]|uniref:VOC family protein n=1 Tax=Paraliomyxa miuraensis TaxID=376150 RepID=UPI0022523EC4|nr:VOC family protein [Paraliomyxa miuraensis]MCX4242541.1 VOC family protein [Paraliomyxa miuraensis]
MVGSLLHSSGCSPSTTSAELGAPPTAAAASLSDERPSATIDGAPSSPVGVLGTDHVGLTVTDLEASRALFVDVLGFRVRGQDESYPAYFLTNGHTTVTLWRAEDPEHATPFDRRRNVGLHHLALTVDGFETLDALHERLSTHPGVVVEFGPELAYGGPAKHMMFYEPSGNRIELVHRPAS